MDALTLATWVGSVLLVVVAALPSRINLRLSAASVATGAWMVAGILLVRLVAGREYLPDTEPSRVLKYGVGALHKALKKPTDNLIVIEGGSYPARAVDPNVLRKKLRELGYRVHVVHMALGAANHLERYTLFSDLLNHEKLKGLSQHPNLVLMVEVQLNYDEQPVAQLAQNQDTARTFHYLSPLNAGYGLWSLWAGGGKEGKTKLDGPGWTVFRHSLVNTFNVGLVDRLAPWDAIKPRSGFVKGGIERGYRFEGLERVLAAAASDVVPDQEQRPWIHSVREARLKSLFGDRADHWVYFGVPSTWDRQIHWQRGFCSQTQDACIAANDADLLGKLDDKRLWRDEGHLTTRGAALYTEWLAGKLVQTGVLKK